MNQAFFRERNEISCQTDPKLLKKISPIRKTIKLQTENYKDIYRTDWAESNIFKRALRDMAEKRGIGITVDVTSDEALTDIDGTSVLDKRSNSNFTPGGRTPVRRSEASLLERKF